MAQYLSDNFPQFLKQKGLLEKENLDAELKKLFIEFDATLCNEKVVEALEVLKEGGKSEKRPEEVEDPEEAERMERAALIGSCSRGRSNKSKFFRRGGGLVQGVEHQPG